MYTQYNFTRKSPKKCTAESLKWYYQLSGKNYPNV